MLCENVLLGFVLETVKRPEAAAAAATVRAGSLAASFLLMHLPLFLAHFLKQKEAWRMTVSTWLKAKPS